MMCYCCRCTPSTNIYALGSNQMCHSFGLKTRRHAGWSWRCVYLSSLKMQWCIASVRRTASEAGAGPDGHAEKRLLPPLVVR